MPGQYLTEEEMYQICRRAAEAAATQYGVKDVEAFTQAMVRLVRVAFTHSRTASTFSVDDMFMKVLPTAM